MTETSTFEIVSDFGHSALFRGSDSEFRICEVRSFLEALCTADTIKLRSSCAVVLVDTGFHLYVADAPLKGLPVTVEEDIKPIPLDGAAPVEYLDGLAVIVAGNNHLGAEGVSLIGCHETVARTYPVAAGRYACRVFTTAFRARTISSDTHSLGLPLFGWNCAGSQKEYKRACRDHVIAEAYAESTCVRPFHHSPRPEARSSVKVQKSKFVESVFGG
jgi:hypothetical protein